MATWERGLDPYEFGHDADVFHTDGGIAGMMTHSTGAIEVTFDDEHIRLRAPFIIGPDVAVDKSEVLAGSSDSRNGSGRADGRFDGSQSARRFASVCAQGLNGSSGRAHSKFGDGKHCIGVGDA